MAFDKMTDDMNIISKLPDEPNDEGGMTAAVLKATFDKAGMLAKTAINKLIAALGASTAAGNIGFARSTEVPSDTVQGAIENVQSQIAGVALGSIPDGSITAQQLADGAVTAEKVADGAVTSKKMEAIGVTSFTCEISSGIVLMKVTQLPAVRDGQILPFTFYGDNITIHPTDVVRVVSNSTGDVLATIDMSNIEGTGTILKSANYYLLLCTNEGVGGTDTPSFVFPNTPVITNV